MVNRPISDESHPHQATPVMHYPAIASSWHQPQKRLPEDFVPSGCRLAAAHFSPGTGRHDDTHIPLPAMLERATRRRRAEFVAGRRCARMALLGLTGRPDYPAIGPERAPLWPTGVVGTISHCRDQAIALAGPMEYYRGLGIDLEQPFSATQSEDLGPIVLARGESAPWNAALRPFLVSLSFSAKESLFKALFPLVQRRFDFAAAELIEWDLQGHAVLRLRISLGGEWQPGLRFPVRHCRFQGLLLTRVAISASTVSVRGSVA
ncbi:MULTISPECIES: 4'-phosphopantetheinyl transferase superfamily protein [unclassified Modicisalibacter]|uniref:4'-phosphopantetheinyl transferase family protein n=1 Tax=unclassified Modicisalibacter TaxID=2679913 RepID=UPI001CCA065D|nr:MULTISPECIES: 4'-phosphopantetheinyl transferase superfamily protein [unclassified Modicisalibacter]